VRTATWSMQWPTARWRRMLRSYEYAVAVLDWRMPHKAGIDVLDEVRRAGIRTPILMLTARMLRRSGDRSQPRRRRLPRQAL